MSLPLKMLTALPLIALTAGCVAGGNDRVDTLSEIEATTDDDIDGDGTVPQGGVEVAASD
ncbi:hypothetical protein MWU52_11290 [Jannaschia sp. S6380]|uniref:hypothetical protein n=1 Tax=Jannaschia sp. S6380 TaxID=2926408 RepID=UPI001FF3D31E|nr:hypothetical protein [Jannaschia sp. S6380]MCK0168138.1 hypothetical protein [Jannaschia sp. S6380]